jgi:opacity protein-like surface antigen
VGALIALTTGLAHADRRPAAIGTQAFALAPVYNWTGFYAGLHAGYGFGKTTYYDEAVADWSLTHDLGGAVLGGQFGYNLQSGVWVYGIEASAAWSGIQGSGVDPDPRYTGDIYNAKPNWLVTLTGRFGYAFDRTLFYAKAGGALVHTKFDYFYAGASGPPIGATTGSMTRAGIDVGGGLEYALGGNWSARLEFDTIYFGTAHGIDMVPLDSGFVADIYQTLYIAKLGLNYRFSR